MNGVLDAVESEIVSPHAWQSVVLVDSARVPVNPYAGRFVCPSVVCEERYSDCPLGSTDHSALSGALSDSL